MLRRISINILFLGHQIKRIQSKNLINRLSSQMSSNEVNEDFKERMAIINELKPSFFVRNIGLSTKKWISILEKHPELKKLKINDLRNTLVFLKKLNFTAKDIGTNPMILYMNELTLENRYEVLQECGFSDINIAILGKYITVMNKNTKILKSFKYISYDTNVGERLRKTFTDLELSIPEVDLNDENITLKLFRQRILNYYLQQRLGMNNKEIERLWKIYSRVKHRNFRSIQKMVEVLKNLQFPNERIIKNAYLLYGDATNAIRIINEVPSIDGQDIRVILYKRPKLLMSSCDSLLTAIKYIKEFDINEKALIKCVDVLTLGPETILRRLKDLHKVDEFTVFKSNPRFLRLVHYQNKARLRLEYLNQLKMRCASLHILSCSSETFAKFARDGSDRTRGRDIIVFLSNIMNKDEYSLRNELSRHPNWCHIPVAHIKQCYEFLLRKKFTIDDIYNNIHLLLYSIDRIDEKLQQLYSSKYPKELLANVNVNSLNNSQILNLLLYFIEREFHFTGDGIWSDKNQIENFNSILPDFPEGVNKIFNYDMKQIIPDTPVISHKEYTL